jgi:pimeloyl-ACP methyl ester carboxylesterase
MTTSYYERGPGRIAYDVRGEGPLILCVPGMGDLRSVYRILAPALADAGFRVATMDLRGHGDSDDGFPAYDDVAAGADIVALVEHLGAPALVVGNSMAAGAAVWAAAERPELIGGLVLAGPFVRNPPISSVLRPVLRLALRLAFVRPWGPALWRTYYRKAYPGRPPADLAQHQDRIAAAMKRGSHWRSFARTTRTDHAPAERRLGTVDTPVLVVMGEKDPDWTDAVAEARFVAGALNGELLLVPEAGHYAFAEYPEIVTPAVVAFARRVHARA